MASEAQAESRISLEGGERPVREQLKKTTIDTPSTAGRTNGMQDDQTTTDPASMSANEASTTLENILHKKRSFEEVDTGADLTDTLRNHTRKRSRDSTAEGDGSHDAQSRLSSVTTTNLDGETQSSTARPTSRLQDISPGPSEGEPEEVASPKTKRSKLHDSTASGTVTSPEKLSDASAATIANGTSSAASATGDVASKNHTATPKPSADEQLKSSQPTTSASAFAASGFGALASSTSAFGVIGQTSGGFGLGGSFAGKSDSSKPVPGEDSKGYVSPFGGASAFGGPLGGTSAFASKTPYAGGTSTGASGFAALGSGTSVFATTSSPFGSLSGGGLTSFAGGKSSSTIGNTGKTARLFGASAGDDDDDEQGGDDDDNEDGVKSPSTTDDHKQDERFYEQEIETGEENEDTLYTCRAKLYNFTSSAENKKEWKERGLGTLRLNVVRLKDDDTKIKARLIMRADGSHRVVLNSPITKDIKFGSPSGGPPTGSYLLFVGTMSTGSVEPLQLKMKAQFALELYDKITELQADM